MEDMFLYIITRGRCEKRQSHSNGLGRLSQFKNVAASTRSKFWIFSPKSTCCAEMALATPPNVSIALTTPDFAGFEDSRLGVFDSDMSYPRVTPPVA